MNFLIVVIVLMAIYIAYSASLDLKLDKLEDEADNITVNVKVYCGNDLATERTINLENGQDFEIDAAKFCKRDPTVEDCLQYKEEICEKPKVKTKSKAKPAPTPEPYVFAPAEPLPETVPTKTLTPSDVE